MNTSIKKPEEKSETGFRAAINNERNGKTKRMEVKI